MDGIKVLKDFKGSNTGCDVVVYKKGEVVSMSDSLYKSALKEGDIEAAKPEEKKSAGLFQKKKEKEKEKESKQSDR